MSVSESAERACEQNRKEVGPLLWKFAKSMLGLSGTAELLCVALATFVRDLGERLEAQARLSRPDLEKRFGEGTRDIVEEASWESFPASDAPPY